MLDKHNSKMVRCKANNVVNFLPAFTIVELLVVIVVIGVLATISIVSYTGISAKAIEASIITDLTNSSKRLKMFQVENSGYPESISDCPSPASGNLCIKPSGSNVIASYVKDNAISPQGFCLNITNGSKSYKITSTTSTTPVLGNCSGTQVTTNLTADYQTPGSFTWNVPSGVTSVQIEAWGAQGGRGGDVFYDNHGGVGAGGASGLGGYSKGVLSVVANDILDIVVGIKSADISERDITYEWYHYVDVYPINGGKGSDSSVSRSTVLLAKGYGGNGGTGGGYHADADYPEYDYIYSGATGANGTGYVNGGLLASTSIIGTKSGNGRVLISYQRTQTNYSF